jgi:hypothetical protein
MKVLLFLELDDEIQLKSEDELFEIFKKFNYFNSNEDEQRENSKSLSNAIGTVEEIEKGREFIEFIFLEAKTQISYKISYYLVDVLKTLKLNENK